MSIDQPIPSGSDVRIETGAKRPRSPSNAPLPALKRQHSVKHRAEPVTRGFFLAYIDAALAKLSKGDAVDYQAIISVFAPWLRRDGDEDIVAAAAACDVIIETPTRMRAWLDALTHAMPKLDASLHAQLIETILSMTWTGLDDICIGPYIRFVAVLLGSKPEYVGFVVKRAVKGLHYRTGIRAKSSTSAAEITRRLSYDRIHRLIQTLVERIPTVPDVLLRQISSDFPHLRESKEAHVVYFRNALRTIEYCPAFFDDLLAAVVGAAIRIDAEIQVEIDDFEEDAGKLDQEVFGIGNDPFEQAALEEATSDPGGDADEIAFSDLSSDVEGQAQDEDETERLPPKPDGTLSAEVVERLKEMASKLDAIMDILFSFLERLQKPAMSSAIGASSSPSSSSPPSTEAVEGRQRRIFASLLRIFERTILKTFKTRHTQFLIFRTLSFDTTFCEEFIVFLMDRALFKAEGTPVVTRVAALCYLASFVSRAAFVDALEAQNVVHRLLEHIVSHLDVGMPAATSSKSIIQQHAVFYAAVQAAFYIFCFRWRDLMVQGAADTEEPSVSQFLPEMDILRRAVTSPFNPLRMCSLNVATQFARVAHQTEFMYCFSVIEQNRRLEAAKKDRLAGRPTAPLQMQQTPPPAPLVQQTLNEARMESHFPFDPYKLPVSGAYVASLYREWQDPCDGDEADDDDDAALETPQNGVPISTSGHLGPGKATNQEQLGSSFQAMSLSPDRVDEMQPLSLVVQ